MTDSHHSHDHHHGHHHNHGRKQLRPPGGWHTGLVAIIALVLMLAGIGAYVLTLDDSNPPPGAAPAGP